MHPRFAQASELTESIIGAAIEVHRDKGPGLIESIYEWCLIKELELRGLACVVQKAVVVEYMGFTREEPLRFDALVEGCVLVEVKSVQSVLPIHKAQLISYMKLMDVPVGLLFNFHVSKLIDGIARLILPGANRDDPALRQVQLFYRRKQRKRRIGLGCAGLGQYANVAIGVEQRRPGQTKESRRIKKNERLAKNASCAANHPENVAGYSRASPKNKILCFLCFLL